MKSKVLVLLAVLFSTQAFSQSTSADLALGFNGNNIVIAPGVVFQWSLLNERIGIGTGLRMNYLSSSDVVFNNESYSDFSELGAFATDQISSFSSMSFNVPLHASLRFSEKFGLGFNIDVIGLTFGKGGDKTSYLVSTPDQNQLYTKVEPSSLNLLLGGAADLGTLNSEFYLQYNISRIGIRAGYSIYFSEIKVENANLDVTRLRTTFGMGIIGARFRISG